jgi:hypothetical protein
MFLYAYLSIYSHVCSSTYLSIYQSFSISPPNCLYVYIRLRTHARTYTYVYKHVHIHYKSVAVPLLYASLTHAHTHTHIHTCAHYIHTSNISQFGGLKLPCVYLCVSYKYINSYTYMYIHTYMYIYTYMYVHTYILRCWCTSRGVWGFCSRFLLLGEACGHYVY